jgi:hypothetical protein
VTVTPQAAGISVTGGGTNTLALAPATIVVTGAGLATSTGAVSRALAPATVTITPVPLAPTGAVALGLAPSTITVAGVGLGTTPGPVSAPLTPAVVTVTPQSVAVYIVSDQFPALTPATVTVVALTLDKLTGLFIEVFDLPRGPDDLQEAVWSMGSGYWNGGTNL